VLKSPVRSRFLDLLRPDRGPNRSALIPGRPKTGPGPQKTAVFGLFRSMDRSQFELVLNRFKTGPAAYILNLLVGKFINISVTFKMSPRTLILVKNWCSYEIIRVHLLFT